MVSLQMPSISPSLLDLAHCHLERKEGREGKKGRERGREEGRKERKEGGKEGREETAGNRESGGR